MCWILDLSKQTEHQAHNIALNNMVIHVYGNEIIVRCAITYHRPLFVALPQCNYLM